MKIHKTDSDRSTFKVVVRYLLEQVIQSGWVVRVNDRDGVVQLISTPFFVLADVDNDGVIVEGEYSAYHFNDIQSIEVR